MARPGLIKHRKFKRLVQMLQEPAPHVLGYLEMMWGSCYETGNPYLGDETDVELTAEYPGDPGKLFRALLGCGGENSAGFIEPVAERPGTYQVHDLFENAPDYVRKRQKRESERKNKDLRSFCPPNGSQRPPNGSTPAPTPAPTPKDIPPSEVCSEPPQAAASELAAKIDAAARADECEGTADATDGGPGRARKKPTEDASPVAMTFPVVGQKDAPKEWHLREAKVAEYREAYPGVDVLAECRKALQWARDNQAKRKTARGMPAFLGRWLDRVQNRGGPPAAPNRTHATQRRNENGDHEIRVNTY